MREAHVRLSGRQETPGGDFAATPLGVQRAGTGRTDRRHTTAGVGADRTAALRAVARRAGVGLSPLLVTAWTLLLTEYCGVREVVFGLAGEDRPHDPVAVRLSVGRGTPLGELLDTVAGRRYPHAPWSELRDASPDPDRRPSFGTLLEITEERGRVEAAVGGASTPGGEQPQDGPDRRCPLRVRITTGEVLTVVLDHNRDEIDDGAADRIAGHLCHLLDVLARTPPETPVGRLTVLSESELRRIVHDWNDTRVPDDDPACVHELVERQAARTPDAVAVLQGDDRLTYAELDRAADTVARNLVAAGAGPGQFVGIHMDRTVHTVVALLGILKSGAAYLPVDRSLPRDRVRHLLAAVDCTTVVTSPACVPELRSLHAELPALKTLLWLGPGTREETPAEGSGPAVRSALEPAPDLAPVRVRPDDLAYVIFTSGSTGAPKAVTLSHAPVVNLIRWVNTTFAVGSADRVLFVTALGFDLSVYDVFGMLAAGGSVRVATDDERHDPRRLLTVLDTEPITFWDSAPAALQQLEPLYLLRPAPPVSALRLVFLSGDWIPLTLPDTCRAAFPGAEVVALGGATEAAIWSNHHRVGRVDPAGPSIPYGRPIQNARYHVLDEDLRPVPVGVPGDLHIGGECLALGYHGDPGLTAVKFVPDPFSDRPGARLYVTGDRARYWPDGTIEFLGRRDGQVKVRGFRIELGEIEAQLAARPEVASAAAAVHTTHGGQRLVAYVVPVPGRTADPTELRAHLAERSAAFMVPSDVLVLEELPVTANGKLDRGALPAPPAPGSGGRAHVPPRTAAEEAVAAIWADVLDVERVGAEDDFFALGGQSLVATRMIARLRVLLDIDVPLPRLMDHPRLADFALVVEQALAERLDDLDEADGTGDTDGPREEPEDPGRRLAGGVR
ncbi:non-ribosomal peptide synthetase [Streptomyces pini]|uniref:Amino acid adenylation domain-containing protein n=1 Tax=Streptomyces pini TaxID=1520580 RepID=A0A1I4GTU5_9ACTN|nr:non-ribosomal peptide synthetase [Streptomyces pini]SFL32940.1 amino acid adenylation domain-containing protein [Streptomyces pini]